jgi:hypothetical protein
MLLAGVEALGAKAHGVNQSQLLSRVSQGLQPLAQLQLRQQLIPRLQALQERAQLDLSPLRQPLTQASRALQAQVQSVQSRLLQPLTRQLQAMLERLQSVRSPSMQQAQPLSQAFLERHQSDRLRQTPQQMYPLQVTLVRLRLVLSRWLQTTSSAFQGLNLHQRLELSLQLQRLTLLLQVCLLMVWLAARWCGEKLCRAKTQAGLLLMTVKRQAGLLLMTVKRQVGKR